MPRKLKRTSIALTDENWRQLDALTNYFNENRSEVLKRSLTLLYYVTFQREKEKQNV